jgi:hypothetical protein
METLVNNPQKGRLETISGEFTKNNTTWFAVKDKGIHCWSMMSHARILVIISEERKK